MILADPRRFVPKQGEPIMAHTPNTTAILVIGPCSTPNQLADLTAMAYDVADRLHVRAVVANSMEYDVTDYAAVMVGQSAHESVSATVLWGDALAGGVPTLNVWDLNGLPYSDVCAGCLTFEDDVEPVLVNGVWTPAHCRWCKPAARKAERAIQRAERNSRALAVTA